jgi:muramoyltetrapeptide carboxypeptidase
MPQKMTQKMKPKYQTLQQGDIVEVIAPAYGIKPSEVEKICDYIRSLGLVPRVPDDLLEGDIICSASIATRFKHLKNALFAPDSKAIWCVKGGSGSPQLIPLLQELTPPKTQKLFIAFSDITSIHFFLNQNWGWQTVHGPILWQIIRERIDAASITQVENVIFGRDYKRQFELKNITPNLPNQTTTQTINSDAIIGGNLKLVQCSIATPWAIQPKNKILLFEDINERPYQIDRALTHILQSKLFDGAAAIIFGDFEGGDIEVDMPIIEQVLQRFAAQINIPVFKCYGIGHTQTNYAIHFGAPAKINIYDNISTLEVL